jgi:hypothetical protein
MSPQSTHVVEQIQRLADESYGEFLPRYTTLHSQCVGIRTHDPDRCAQQAMSRGIGPVNTYLAGTNSVVCFPLVPALVEGNTQ